MEHDRFACALVSLCNRESLSSTQRGNKRDEGIWPEEEDWTRADRARFASQREQLFISFHARARGLCVILCLEFSLLFFWFCFVLLRGSNEKSRGVHTYCTYTTEKHSDTRAMTDMCSVRSFCSSRRSRQWGHYSHNNNWSSHSNGCVTGQR